MSEQLPESVKIVSRKTKVYTEETIVTETDQPVPYSKLLVDGKCFNFYLERCENRDRAQVYLTTWRRRFSQEDEER